MIGGILGDYFGSPYEGGDEPDYNQTIGASDCTITDETVLLCATAECMIRGDDFAVSYKKWANAYPDVAYGPGFSAWLSGSNDTHNSLGNGAASRCGVLGYLQDESEVVRLAEQSAICSHKHPEAINGAQAVAWTVWAIRNGLGLENIVDSLYNKFNYFILYDLEGISGSMGLDSTAEVTVPIALWVGLHTKNTTDCLRQCFQIGGDTDSIASIACLINQQRFSVDKTLVTTTKDYLKEQAPLILHVCEEFEARFPDIR